MATAVRSAPRPPVVGRAEPAGAVLEVVPAAVEEALGATQAARPEVHGEIGGGVIARVRVNRQDYAQQGVAGVDVVQFVPSEHPGLLDLLESQTPSHTTTLLAAERPEPSCSAKVLQAAEARYPLPERQDPSAF